MTKTIQEIRAIIEDVRICMLTSRGAGDRLFSRPMALADLDADNQFWFFTHKHSPKIDEVGGGRPVNLAFASGKDNTYLSVSGLADDVYDRVRMEQLYTPSIKVWFPKGLDDPDLTLLKVVAESVEYWDGPASRVAQLIGIARATLTGDTYQPGEVGTVML